MGNADRPPAEVERLLVPLLDDPNDQVKVQAAKVLANQVGPVPAVVDGLCRMLNEDDSSWVQMLSAVALGRLGPGAASAGPALVRAARTGEAGVREQAIRALALIQPPEALDAFTVGLKDPSAEVRLIASAGWVKAAAIPEPAIKPLVEALKDPETQVRANAAFALSKLDRPPVEAIPSLIDCTADPSDSLRLNATLALGRAPFAAVAETLGALLDDPSPRVRVIAAGAILAADRDHARAREVAEAARTDPSPKVRQAAEDLLRSLEEPEVETVAIGADRPTLAEVVPLTR
jgi:HEAT repeat protein